MRVINISDIANQNMNEIGYFDTYPANNNANYRGSWNVYPFFASGNIVISGEGGFTLVKESNLGINDNENFNFSLAPNPARENVTISSKDVPIQNIEIYSVLGQKVLDKVVPQNVTQTINISSLKTGMYLVTINKNTTLRLVVN